MGARPPRVLDFFFDRMRNAVGSQEREWGLPVVEKLSLQPSEYWARQCHVGASFIRPSEVPIRERVGVDRIMWGSDYPHKESSFPFSHGGDPAQLRGRRPRRGAMMLGANAAALYGFDLDALRPLAQEFGPRVVHRRRAVDRGRRAGRGAEVPGIRRDRTRRRLTSRVSRRTRRG